MPLEVGKNMSMSGSSFSVRIIVHDDDGGYVGMEARRSTGTGTGTGTGEGKN